MLRVSCNGVSATASYFLHQNGYQPAGSVINEFVV
jgi:hypothetical protein